ncbi:MAG: Phosphoenolpyruvate carboxylase [Candidatus Methanohalarchaeum thermophilum]|uniref:Phosphoenolpyruvate carboxylase n=1 Tax=Methanohalarchaeum thermophilum TaxID=1903181 RepID=A0A1Q6DV48_METT1|nr:MAG: Phosphoenolpyruvate carboxylase [Candidatus Methanohalarchaeum thermophilum]
MKIPTTMVTQHPDSATKYTPIQDEAEEGLDSLKKEEDSGLGSEEYMVDYEGKMTPYHQVSQIVMEILEETDLTPGEDVFITPRIPSATQETVFRQLMTLMSIMEANYQASRYIDNLSVFEVIHPMTAEASELIDVRSRFKYVSKLSKKEFNMPKDFHIHLIPLIEEVPELLNIGDILEKYVDGCKKELDIDVNRLRVMLGRSDPALSYGMMPATLSVKSAISECYKLGEKKDVNVAPIYGAGALPFRGHVMPDNSENVIKEFAGSKTVTIQSGVRYDIGKKETKQLIKDLREGLPKQDPLYYNDKEMEEIRNLIGVFTKHYLKTFYQIIENVKKISDLMPNQRDRLARKGPMGYARDVPMPSDIAEVTTNDKLKKELRDLQLKELPELPRAIKFTASLYTLGLPPEFIGTGRGLKEAEKTLGTKVVERLLEDYYPSIKDDMKFAARFVNLKLAREFFPESAVKEVDNDIKTLMNYIDFEIGPKTKKDERYLTLMETIKPVVKQVAEDKKIILSEESEKEMLNNGIKKMGKLRGSLG